MNNKNELIIKDLKATCKCNFYLGKVIDSCDLTGRTLRFTSGKVYGVKGNINGAWALAHTLAGKTNKYSGTIIFNGNVLNKRQLKNMSCYVREYPKADRCILGKKKTGYDRLKLACEYKKLYRMNDIMELFELEKLVGINRLNRIIAKMGTAAFNMTASIGYAYGKVIFVFPWLDSRSCEAFYFRINHIVNILKKDKSIITIIPAYDPKNYLGDIFDEVVDMNV